MVDNQSMLVLSKTEQDIMKVLWDAAKPLSVSEICDYATSTDIELNQSTVQASVAKLLKKGIISNQGFSQNYKSYARAFVPMIQRADYVMTQAYQLVKYFGNAEKDSRLSALMATLDREKQKSDPTAPTEGDKGNGK